MREAFAGFLSTIAAATAPAAMFALYVHSFSSGGRPGSTFVAFCMSFMVAFAHAMILGLPAALILVHKGKFRAIPMLLAGGFVGLLPAGLLFFPYTSPHDWLSFAQFAISAFTLGAAGGISFYGAHIAISPNNSFKPTPLRGVGKVS